MNIVDNYWNCLMKGSWGIFRDAFCNLNKWVVGRLGATFEILFTGFVTTFPFAFFNSFVLCLNGCLLEIGKIKLEYVFRVWNIGVATVNNCLDERKNRCTAFFFLIAHRWIKKRFENGSWGSGWLFPPLLGLYWGVLVLTSPLWSFTSIVSQIFPDRTMLMRMMSQSSPSGICTPRFHSKTWADSSRRSSWFLKQELIVMGGVMSWRGYTHRTVPLRQKTDKKVLFFLFQWLRPVWTLF